jgi:hypothetical protein
VGHIAWSIIHHRDDSYRWTKYYLEDIQVDRSYSTETIPTDGYNTIWRTYRLIDHIAQRRFLQMGKILSGGHTG